MYEPHPLFITPEDGQVVWRYMDLPKLVAFLGNEALWFARADSLGDPHEGAYGPLNASMRSQIYPEIPAEGLAQIQEATRLFVNHTYINCWHMSDMESAAMWGLYTAAGQGVAVRSTFAGLRDALRSEAPVHIGRVTYVDPESEWIPEGNSFWPFLHKRRSFAHEAELRLVIQRFPSRDEPISLFDESPPGLSIDVDVPTLVEEVVIAPGQPGWFGDAVRLAVHALVPNLHVRQSSMDRDPVY